MAVVRISGVSSKPDSAAELGAAALRSLHQARAAAELAASNTMIPGADAVAPRGNVFAQVVVVKGLAGPAEATGGAALSGPDGEAALKALTALGWDPDDVFFTLSRPVTGSDGVEVAQRLRLQIESVDPELVVALDAEAAADVAAALGIVPFAFGEIVLVEGRRVMACDGLEASLTDVKRKQRVWAQLKNAVPRGAVY